MLCLSCYFLFLLFNKIRDKGRTGSAWKRREERGEMTQTMYAHVNK
jgi:hypothetical protein